MEVNRTIFTNMFSIINPCDHFAEWPVSLQLPNLFSELEEATPKPVRKAKEVTECPHSTRKHYAMNMCAACYHREGRKKLCWACPHLERHHYAKGKCQRCYLRAYYRSKVENSASVLA
mmetsp:Transcript_2853/g.6144  ORF Transcript_2853/g.6144 Transcript_2853/m.6144 type:complete len:118 (-) Transcript_2853:100-453(-)